MSPSTTEDPIIEAIRKRADEARFAMLAMNDREIKNPELRRVILREMRTFTDYVVEVLMAVRNEGVMLNEQWLDRIREVHEAVVGTGNLR